MTLHGSSVSGSFPTKGVSGKGVKAVDEVNWTATMVITPKMNMLSLAD